MQVFVMLFMMVPKVTTGHEGGRVRQNTTDPPTLICIKHNGDDEPED